MRLGQPGLRAAAAAAVLAAAAAAGCGGGGGGGRDTATQAVGTSPVPVARAPVIKGKGTPARCARLWNVKGNRQGQVDLAQFLGNPGLQVQIGLGRSCQLLLTDQVGQQQIWVLLPGHPHWAGPSLAASGGNPIYPLDVTSAGYVKLANNRR